MTRSARTPWWGEIPLVLVSVATVLGFIRVYDGWDFLPALLAFALGAHATAIASRRLRVPGTLVVLLAVVGAAFATAWILFPDTTAMGIPTLATWDAATASLRLAREQYPVVLAPTEVIPGFQLAAGLALWIAAWFGDWAAHRLRATAEGVAATTAIFVFCAVLGSGRYEIICAAGFAAAVLLFVGVQRTLAIEREQAWMPGNRTTARAVLRSSALVAVVALAIGVVVGPSLPGARSEAAIEWRGSNSAERSRVTISPMVELKKRLVEQSDQEVFNVRTDEPAYWRLTSLDSFDGEIWSSSGEFKQAGERLPSDAPADGPFANIRQRFTIEALAAIWAPTAFEAVSVQNTETPLRWDPDSSTLIVDSSEPTSDGLTYTVVSQVPRLDRDRLEGTGGTDPQAIRDRYLNLPEGFPAVARGQARAQTAAAESRYEAALALQDWFRSEFEYSLEPEAGHSDDALVAFLESGEGYCEQFAGAYAAMARSLGIPARVAVGFTPGIADGTDPDLYRVYGRNAHAWPEVYFPGTGWVAFEPTPGRGMPGAEEYTGVEPAQDATAPETPDASTTAVPTTAASAAEDDGSTTPTQPSAQERAETTGAAPATEPDGATAPWRIALAVILVAGLLAALVLRRRRNAARSLAALSPADRTWAHVCALLASRHDLHSEPADTPIDVADRAAPLLDEATGAELRTLAERVTEARWSPTGLSDEDQFDALAASVAAALDRPVPAAV